MALADLSVDITAGEIIALLGPNGAGKTTLISIICGLTTLTAGNVFVDGFDIETDYREARSLIGLVPRLVLEPFETIMGTVTLSRASLVGLESKLIKSILENLSLWDKRASPMKLSGGMKRRVLIAKALSHSQRFCS